MCYISNEKEPQNMPYFCSVGYQAYEEELLQTIFLMLIPGK